MTFSLKKILSFLQTAIYLTFLQCDDHSVEFLNENGVHTNTVGGLWGSSRFYDAWLLQHRNVASERCTNVNNFKGHIPESSTGHKGDAKRRKKDKFIHLSIISSFHLTLCGVLCD